MSIKVEKSDRPINVAGMAFIEIEGVNIFEYHPLPDGKGKPTQVHMHLDIKGTSEHKLVLRIKSREYANRLINALIKHTNNVWPLA